MKLRDYQIKTLVSPKRNPMFIIVDHEDKPIKVYNNIIDAKDKLEELNNSLSLSLEEILTNTPFNILESVN